MDYPVYQLRSAFQALLSMPLPSEVRRVMRQGIFGGGTLPLEHIPLEACLVPTLLCFRYQVKTYLVIMGFVIPALLCSEVYFLDSL